MLDWSEDTLKKIIERSPAKINFAGLGGTTADMVRNGWELNVMKRNDECRDSIDIRIGGRHKSLSLQFLSGIYRMDYEFFSARARDSDPMRVFSRVPWEIRIEHIARNMIVNDPAPMKMVSRDWSGYLDIMKPSSNVSFEKLFEFPEASSQIYIPENKLWTIQEHMDAIRSAQQPIQDEILRDSISNQGSDHKQLLKLVAI